MIVSPSLDTKYPVIIFKAGRVPINHGAVGIARSLGRLGVRVYAIVEDAYTPLAMCRYVTKSFIWKNWPDSSDKFITALSDLARLVGHPTIILPMDDLSAIYVAENAANLAQWFLFPKLAPELPRQLANKASLQTLCARFEIPHARSAVIRTADDLHEVSNYVSFPVVLKAAQQWTLPNNTYYNTRIIENKQTFLEIFKAKAPKDQTPLLLQEYIPGEDWIYHSYCNAESRLYVSFTGKKLLGYPVRGGATAAGISVRNEKLCSQAENLLRAIAYSGICDMDWRQDNRDGQYKLVDCNPRIGLNFQMFETTSEIDVVRALHLDLTHRRIELAPMIENRLFTAESLYLLSLLRGGRQTALSTRAMIRQVKPTRKLAWWSCGDPLPLFTMSIRVLFGALMRRVVRLIRFSDWRGADDLKW